MRWPSLSFTPRSLENKVEELDLFSNGYDWKTMPVFSDDQLLTLHEYPELISLTSIVHLGHDECLLFHTNKRNQWTFCSRGISFLACAIISMNLAKNSFPSKVEMSKHDNLDYFQIFFFRSHWSKTLLYDQVKHKIVITAGKVTVWRLEKANNILSSWHSHCNWPLPSARGLETKACTHLIFLGSFCNTSDGW